MGRTRRPRPNVIGANDRIQVAIVGVGFGIGQDHVIGIQEKAAENNTVIWRPAMYSTSAAISPRRRANLKDADVYDDYRKMLERKDIDAVLIATHDPWHAQITMDALDSGRHVYCEKPLTRYLGEAFQVYDKVKSSGKVFQIGLAGLLGRRLPQVRRADQGRQDRHAGVGPGLVFAQQPERRMELLPSSRKQRRRILIGSAGWGR